jgi:hypothetical protein
MMIVVTSVGRHGSKAHMGVWEVGVGRVSFCLHCMTRIEKRERSHWGLSEYLYHNTFLTA